LKLRHILYDRYKSKRAQKRDFGVRVYDGELEGIASNEKPLLEEIVIRKLIEKLRKYDEIAAQVTDLLIFWEFSYAEIADLLSISERTAYRKWKWAIAWFKTEVENKGT
jgi:DNA-directed RNA polymerase specialized sigma24 family protein